MRVHLDGIDSSVRYLLIAERCAATVSSIAPVAACPAPCDKRRPAAELWIGCDPRLVQRVDQVRHGIMAVAHAAREQPTDAGSSTSHRR